jgi:glyoxylase-like metal-dependent hydrolase (beta-lactamase superfamily II)
MGRRGLSWLIGTALILGAAYYWLLNDNQSDVDPAPLDMIALRDAANSLPGEKPVSIAVETISRRDLPSLVMVAGGGWRESEIAVHAFQVNAPDSQIIIDTGYSRDAARAMDIEDFDEASQQRVSGALASAFSIVVTHEHNDHIGGLLLSPDWAVTLPRAMITKEQFDNDARTAPVVWPTGSRDSFQPLIYQGILAIAPGVVLVKAPSHTPGSQLVFVQFADGSEYLFMGDISSMDRNWRETRARSRLVGDLIVDEDRAAVFSWLRAFKALSEANPDVTMVPSHDGEVIDRLVDAGRLKRGFTGISL